MAKFTTGATLLIALAAFGGYASAATCFKSGERTSGMNKVCYYDCTGSEATKNVSMAELCPMTMQSSNTFGRQEDRPNSGARIGGGGSMACFKTDEEVSGMNKLCEYDCGGSRKVLTISSTALCPISAR